MSNTSLEWVLGEVRKDARKDLLDALKAARAAYYSRCSLQSVIGIIEYALEVAAKEDQ